MTDIEHIERIKMRRDIVTLAVTVGDLDEEIRRALFRRFKDKRYRARQSVRNLERVHAVAEQLKLEAA